MGLWYTPLLYEMDHSIFEALCKLRQHCWPTNPNIVLCCYMLRPFAHPVACLRMLLRVVESCCPKSETGQTFRCAKLIYSNSAVTGVACVLKGSGMKTSVEHGNFKVPLVMAKSPLIVKLISTDLTQLNLSPTEIFASVTYWSCM